MSRFLTEAYGILPGHSVVSPGTLVLHDSRSMCRCDFTNERDGLRIHAYYSEEFDDENPYDDKAFHERARACVRQMVDAIAVCHRVPEEFRFLGGGSVEHGVATTVLPIHLDDVERAHCQLRRNSNRMEVLERALHLIRWADQQDHPEDLWMNRMVLLWMAFEALYQGTEGRNGKKPIEVYLESLNFGEYELKGWVNEQIQKGFFRQLARSKLELAQARGRGNRQVACELAQAIERVNSTGSGHLEVVNALMLTVYALRCHLFHGRGVARDSGEGQMVREAALALDFLVRAIVQKELGVPITGPSGVLHVSVKIICVDPAQAVARALPSRVTIDDSRT